MQIRVANRQDEKSIQTIFAEICKKRGEEFDLNAAHKDLRNIEANYFGNEGIFLVAEEEGTIVGFAGARKSDDKAVSVDRFYIDDAFKRNSIDQQFMQVILPFAKRMFFEKIDWNVVETPPVTDVSRQTQVPAAGLSCFNKALLLRLKFKKNENNHYYFPLTTE